MGAPKGHKPYKGGENGGRPPVQTDSFIEKEADALIEWIKNPKNLYFKKFALERGYHSQRLSEFAQKNKRFAECLEKAKEWQEIRLVEGGLSNTHNASITKFVLQNCHSWVDKQQSTISGDAANPLNFVLGNIDGTTKELVHESECR